MKSGIQQSRLGAFTLIELLTVVAIISVLATLLLTALGRGRDRAQRIQCMNNERQLSLAWIMYAEDHDQRLVGNGFNGQGSGETDMLWVSGGSHLSTFSFVDVNQLLDDKQAAFARYIKNPAVYKCPTDRRTRKLMHRELAQVRSYAMNSYLGPTERFSKFNSAGYLQPQKLSEITQLSPSQTFVFQDVNPDSICFPAFLVEMPGEDSMNRAENGFFHYPSSLHKGVGITAFADGHVEGHNWQDERTESPEMIDDPVNRGERLAKHSGLSPFNPDLEWIQKRTSRKR